MNSRIKTAIDALKNGQMIIMVDDEDRENEGDIVYYAGFSDAKKVNFLLKEARGVVCVALDEQIAKSLELEPMVANNSSSHETAFTVSVDDKNAKTGVSAFERDQTIRLLANPSTKPSDLARPGHIFPLIAKRGGVLERTGHTEGSCDLCKLAGLRGAAVICEIVKEDGQMARRSDLESFGAKHKLPTIFVADIINYRLQHESLINLGEKTACEFLQKPCFKTTIADHDNKTHFAYAFGKINSTCLVKFHTSSQDLVLLEDTKRLSALQKSVEILSQKGGLLVCLSFSSAAPKEKKHYGIGAQILLGFGVKNVELLSAHEKSAFIALNGFGLEVKQV